MAEPCKVCGSEICMTHCTYCGADCDLPEPPHASDCPGITGLFPVRPEDLGVECVHCGKRTPGMSCPRCDTDLGLGDFYITVPIGPGIREVMCVGCGLLAQGSGESQPPRSEK